METKSMEKQKTNSSKGIIEIMDEFDVKILGISDDILSNLPLHIEVPAEDELLRNPYAE